jgi:PHD/YefM family antitoxin component YafN of YafNO toxin-antitoxin module
MTTLKASETRIPSTAFNRVVYKGERVRIERRGGDTVFIVSEEDMALLEAMEDRLDVEAAREALARHKATGGKGIPWEKVKADLGLGE